MNPIKSNGAGPSNAPVKVNFDLSCDISMSNYFKSSFARTMAIDSMKRESRSLDCALFQKQRQGPIHGSKPFKNVHKTNIGTNVWHRAKTTDSPFARSTTTSSDSSTDGEEDISQLKERCRFLEEERRRLESALRLRRSSADRGPSLDLAILQTNADTLHWQLKQAEANRQMYHEVMVQVEKYLERLDKGLNNLALQRGNSRVPRSRSVYEVDGSPSRITNGTSTLGRQSAAGCSELNEDGATNRSAGFARAKSIGQIQNQPSEFSAYSDFTWRRGRSSRADSIASVSVSSASASESEAPDKLRREATSLLRTIRSLLRTREPDLVARRLTTPTPSRGESPSADSSFGMPCINSTPIGPPLANPPHSSINQNSSTAATPSPEPPPMLRCIRGRKSLDTISHSHPVPQNRSFLNGDRAKSGLFALPNEDESGFSSMSSFQEVGLPEPVENWTPSPQPSSPTSAASLRRHSSAFGAPEALHVLWV